MKPVRVKDYRKTALEIFKRLAGYRCTRCGEPVRIPDDGVLWKLGTEYMLTHSNPCKAKR